MKSGTVETDGGDSGEPVRRRKLLAAVGAVGVGSLAGCPGVTDNVGDDEDGGGGGSSDGGDGSDDNDGSDGGNGASGDYSCTDITINYEQQDVGERPMFVDFEYPALFDQLEYVEDAVAFRSEKDAEGEGFFEFTLQQFTDLESEPREILNWEEESKTGWSVERSFNGEEVKFAGDADPKTATVFLNAHLPYEVGGEQRPFRTEISLVASEETEECTAALREAVEHIVGSLSLNEETTLG
jgi:hypothetical protein